MINFMIMIKITIRFAITIKVLIAITFTINIALFFGDLNHEHSHDDGHNITPDHVHGLNYNFVNNPDYNHDQFNAIMIVLTITVMTTANDNK